jgi:hypothetical protein
MLRRSRLVAIAAVIAICSLGALASPATAIRAIRLQPGGEITKAMEGFTLRFFGGEVLIICRLTLRGRLSTIIEKAGARTLPGGRIGQIEGSEVGGCRTNLGGAAEVTVLAPIDLRYEAFTGALPNIGGIIFRKLGFAFQVIEPMIIGTCLYGGIVNLHLSFPPVEEGGGSRFNPERFETPNMIPWAGGVGCPEEVEVNGVGRVTPPQGALLLN